jgi:hypothetical protein
MLESASDATIEEIKAIQADLRRFQSQQSDAAVQLHCIAIDTNLAAALDGQTDSSFREILASNVEHLADAIRAARLCENDTSLVVRKDSIRRLGSP